MRLIRYELQAYFGPVGQWSNTHWPRQEELGEPETLGEARDRKAEKQLRNPSIQYRIIKCTRSIIQ